MTYVETHGICSPHVHGVPAGCRPFFYAGCRVCEAKKAAGKVRGDEGPLNRTGWRKTVKRGSPKDFEERAKRDRAGRLAARGTWG